MKNPAPKRLLGDSVPPLHARVVAELRRAIVDRRYKPGERLVESRLAEELGVSRIPIREAIRALATEGLVEVADRRGASVARMSATEARETIELRALLEGQNARLAARRRDAQVQKRITAVLDKGASAVAAGRFDQLTALNQQFHKELTLAGQNAVLAELLTRLRDRTEMLFAPTDPAQQDTAWAEHAAILRAIIDGDEQAAATLAAEHVTRAGEDFLAGIAVEEAAPPVRGRSAARNVARPKAA
jgi:DNA-binding GntR family transcriptional regulator